MNIEQIKKMVIIALASDDSLVERLVLKGGNAIDLLIPASKGKMSRASYDLDFSMENDFDDDLKEISDRIEQALQKTFLDFKLAVIDYQFVLRPKISSPSTEDFWGGYLISFKVIPRDEFELLKYDKKKLINRAIEIRPNNSTRIEIEISKYEYVRPKQELKVDGFLIYIYSPEMIVFEKLRALCQQLPEYADIVPSFKSRPRARDFYDIHLICEQHEIHPGSQDSKEMITKIFAAKKVPLFFIQLLENNTAIHQLGSQDVLDTLPANQPSESFQYYADFLFQKFGSLTFP